MSADSRRLRSLFAAANPLCARANASLAAVLGAGFALFAAAPLGAQTSLEEVVGTTRSGLAETSEHSWEDAQVDALIELARRDNRVQEHLRALAFDIGPRLTSSTNLTRAGEWARDQFQSWGLTATLEEWGDFPVGFDRGPWSGSMVEPRRKQFVFLTHSWTAGTDGIVRGPAFLSPSNLDELEAMRPNLAGAWIVQAPSEIKERPSRDDRKVIEEAFETAGIAGLIRTAGGELIRGSGNYRVDWEDLPTTASILMRGDHHEDLVETLMGDDGDEVVLEFNIQNTFVEGPVPLYNVVADWRGTEKPDEFVIICGHLDSWDGAQGVNDNGTGCSTTMEAARLLAASGVRAKRTIRFILWSGEEQGLLGSRAYVEQHKELWPKISAVLNHDGGTNYLAGLTGTHEMRPQLEEACAPLIGLNEDFPFELAFRDGLPGGGSSDHASFVSEGVPGFFWNQTGRTVYSFMHHTQYDTFENAIPEYQEHSSLVAAIAALRIANLPDLLNRMNVKPIPPRRSGARLRDGAVSRVSEGSMAEAAGWQVGDVVVSINGEDIEGRRAFYSAIRGGEARKVVVLKRGEELIETVLDFSDDPDEQMRMAKLAELEAKAKAKELEAEAREASNGRDLDSDASDGSSGSGGSGSGNR